MNRIHYYLTNAWLLLAFAATACGQQPARPAAESEDGKARRLEAVTWDPVKHKLTWTVSVGTLDGKGDFHLGNKQLYEIDMDTALMHFKGEDRRFSKEEAVNVHALMDVVAKYAAESTVWWDLGEGQRVDKSQERNPGASQQDENIHRHPPKRRELPQRDFERPPARTVPIRYDKP